MNWWKPYLWRLIFILAGLISAILFLTLGFKKTILILMCCAVGLVLGLLKDKETPEGWWKPYKWRLGLTGLGLFSAILFLTLGFGKALLILLLAGAGFAVGMFKDKGVRFEGWQSRLWFWRDK